MGRVRLSPKAKRIRQKVMHRVTRAMHGPRGDVDVTAYDGWFNSTLKEVVHEALTEALLEETDEDSD